MSLAHPEPRLQADISTAVAPLAAALKALRLAIPARPVVPILGAVLIEADNDTITLSGFDYETSITVRIDGSGSNRIAADYHALDKLVRSLPKTSTVRLAVEDHALAVTCGDLHATVPVHTLDDYPTLPTITALPFTLLDRADLAGLGRVATAAGGDCTLPVLTAIELSVDDDGLAAAATDRYRLAVHRCAGPAHLDAPVLIPAKVLATVAKLLAREDEPVAMLTEGADRGLVAWRTERLEVTTRTVPGEFPKWRTLIPTEFAGTARGDARELSAAIKQVHPGDHHDPLVIDLDTESITLTASSDDRRVTRTITGVSYTGDAMRIAFNPCYLTDGIAVLNAADVHLGVVAPRKPALLTSPDNPATTYLVMPISLPG